MTIIQKIDTDRNLHKHTLYSTGSGFKPSKAYYQGGFITGLIDFVKDNRELLSSGAAAVGKVADLGKSISDTVKTAKELEKIRETNTKNKRKEYTMSPEQEERLKSLGSGFATFERQGKNQ